MHDKPTLRQLMRERLRAIDESTRQQASARIAQHILGSGLRQHAETAPAHVIALFGGLKNEADLLPQLLPALWSQGMRPCFFQIEASELQPRQVCTFDDLQRGQMNVWEPKPHCPRIDIAALDLILVPGLAFTRDGARLGRGGGYYDRLLAHPACRAHRLAIAYDCQIIDHIPVEPHDQRVHQIITESGLIQASASHE